jgi:hypothetical protein
LLAVLAHKGRRRSEPDTHFATGANKRAFGGNAFDYIFGGQNRPPGGASSVMAPGLPAAGSNFRSG